MESDLKCLPLLHIASVQQTREDQCRHLAHFESVVFQSVEHDLEDEFGGPWAGHDCEGVVEHLHLEHLQGSVPGTPPSAKKKKKKKKTGQDLKTFSEQQGVVILARLFALKRTNSRIFPFGLFSYRAIAHYTIIHTIIGISSSMKDFIFLVFVLIFCE